MSAISKRVCRIPSGKGDRHRVLVPYMFHARVVAARSVTPPKLWISALRKLFSLTDGFLLRTLW